MDNEMKFPEQIPEEPETPVEETPVEETVPEEAAPVEEIPPEDVPAEAPVAASADKPPKKKGMALTIMALSLGCALLGSVLGAGGVLLGQYFLENKAAPGHTSIFYGKHEDVVIDITQIDTTKKMTAAEVYAANVNSVVGITTTVDVLGQLSHTAAAGTGFVLTADGYILTNYHVIEGASKIAVSMFSGESYDAKIVGYDESKDIAVLKVAAENLTPVVLGDSENLNVGDDVVAIGNPLGELTFTLTTGVVSAKDRMVTLSNSVTMTLLQTDCAINAGNSGGPLFNMYGEVIGVTNAKYSSGGGASIDNIGFAIPMKSLMKIVTSVIEKGYFSKPYVGVGIADVSKEAQMFGIPAGVAIQSITKESPAESAGLQVGDIITALDGKAMNSDQMVAYVGECEIGKKITMKIYRKGTTLDVTVTVGEQIQSAQ